MKRDIRWLSGLLEGEGTFGSYPKNGCWYIRMGAYQKGREVLDWVAALAGGAVYPAGGERRGWQWALYGAPAVRWMRRLYPHMSVRRSQQIRRAFARKGLSV